MGKKKQEPTKAESKSADVNAEAVPESEVTAPGNVTSPAAEAAAAAAPETQPDTTDQAPEYDPAEDIKLLKLDIKERDSVIEAQQKEIIDLRERLKDDPNQTLRSYLSDAATRLHQFCARRQKYPGSFIALRDQLQLLAGSEHNLLDQDINA